MRPYYKLVGNPVGKPTLLEGSDGSTWEWYADPGIIQRTVGAASAAGRHSWVPAQLAHRRTCRSVAPRPPGAPPRAA
jgi:hypothetical protein